MIYRGMIASQAVEVVQHLAFDRTYEVGLVRSARIHSDEWDLIWHILMKFVAASFRTERHIRRSTQCTASIGNGSDVSIGDDIQQQWPANLAVATIVVGSPPLGDLEFQQFLFPSYRRDSKGPQFATPVGSRFSEISIFGYFWGGAFLLGIATDMRRYQARWVGFT